MNEEKHNPDEQEDIDEDFWLRVLVVAIVLAVIAFVGWLHIPPIPPFP